MKLTKREEQILNFIRKHAERRGYPPTVREIGRAVGLSSTSTVYTYLNRLEKKGCLRRDRALPRAMEVIGDQEKQKVVYVPVLGRIAAGLPILAVEDPEGVLALPADLVGSGEFFALRVRGDSMVEAGIFDGDLVVVRRQPTAENGDIVAALLNDEATVKRFFKENGYIRLQPENRAMEPIITGEAVILGKVVSLFRKY